MNVILNISPEKFSLNGIHYFKNFMPHVVAGKIKIVNTYDSKFELIGLDDYSNYSIDGVNYSDVSTLQDALLPVLYSRNSLGYSSGVPPEVSDFYVKKMESTDFIADYGATTVIDKIDLIDDRSSISLIGSATDIKSVQLSGEFIRPGKPHFFKNRTGHNVKLWHLAGTGNIKYFFPDSLDLVVSPNQVISFNTNANDSANVRFEYVGNYVDLTDYYIKSEVNNADALILGAANSYTDSKVSSIYKIKPSVANFASLPSSGNEDGDVRNVTDTGMNYVWTGSVWDALGTTVDISGKEDKTQKGAPGGYAPLDEFTKLAAQYLNIVNDLVTGGTTALLSAEQGKVLKTQIDAINTLLTSDNVNLDNVQELVDAIETVQMSLSTILVNDLTTGGTTKALTAEMGKQLDLIKESTANKSTSIAVDYLSNIKFPSVKAVYDFCMSAFKKKFLDFGDVSGIAHTFGVGSENTMYKFSNNNPITATIPTNATTPFEIGTVFETIAIGNGALTVTGAPGVTMLTNLSNTSVKNEVRRYTKIDTDTWTISGSVKENETLISFTKSNYWGLVNPNWYIGRDGTSLQITTDSGTQNLITALSGFCTRNNVAIAPYDMKLISIVCARRAASAAIIGVVKGTPTAEHTIASVVNLYEGTSFSSNPSIIIDLDFNTQPIISKGQLVRFSVRHTQTGAANSSDTYTFTFKKV